MNNFPQSIYSWYRNTVRNPKYRWWMILGTLLYIFSPFDIVPDLIPFFGPIDDVLILSILVSEISQLVLDKAKSRKDGTVASDTGNSTEKTVDVNAVSVK